MQFSSDRVTTYISSSVVLKYIFEVLLIYNSFSAALNSHSILEANFVPQK